MDEDRYTAERWQALYTPIDSWDEMFQAGCWDYLSGVGELPHYSLVAGYVHKLAKRGRLLDAGCGEGVLAGYLDLSRFEYVGFDLSAEAVRRANHRVPSGRIFECAMEEFETKAEDAFHAIVFSECLQCIKTPMETIDAFKRHLVPDGVLIISVYHSFKQDGNGQIFTRFLEAEIRRGRYTLVDASEARSITHNLTWKVFCLR